MDCLEKEMKKVKVTKFKYALDDNLLEKINLMTERCVQKNPKRDAVLLIEGAEGEGKTSLSVALAYYISSISNREFSHKNIFFDVAKMIKFLQNTDGQIAIWDEPALQALSGDALSRVVKNLKRMLMMCRNKRHFIIINMTYFTEFGGYIVWQRPLGMIHVYSRNGLQAGRFVYIRKKYLERLWLDWKSKKQRNYKKWGSNICRGTFPDVLNPDYKGNVLEDFNFNAYEKNKNDAISSIGVLEERPSEDKLRKDIILEMIRNNENSPNKLTNEQVMKVFGIGNGTFYRYKRALSSSPILPATINNNKGNTDKILADEQEDDSVVPILYSDEKEVVPKPDDLGLNDGESLDE
jgi:hypothetical protein